MFKTRMLLVAADSPAAYSTILKKRYCTGDLTWNKYSRVAENSQSEIESNELGYCDVRGVNVHVKSNLASST
jgi:hypothetical protein